VYPTQPQLQTLREAVASGAPEIREIRNGEISLPLPANGLAVIGIK
jgi:hypothetical protein